MPAADGSAPAASGRAAAPAGRRSRRGWGWPATRAGPRIAVTGVTLDSRAVRPGDLYAALPGSHAHGADFAAQAVAAGAVAVLTDAAGATAPRRPGCRLPVLVVDDPRAVLGRRRGLGLRRPVRAAAAGRRHRHERQDHDRVPGRGRPARGRSPHRAGRHGRDPGRATRWPTARARRRRHRTCRRCSR